MKKKIVLKIGTSTLTGGTGSISRGKIEDIARQIVQLRDEYDIILVSSGAIATARQMVTLSRWKDAVESRQALSAIGQPKLFQIYSEVFSDFGIRIAQCLLTYRDFEFDRTRTNTLNTIDELMRHEFIPIINENDTVAIEELTLGDNDKLSAYVATLVKADLLVLASDIDGLFDQNPHLNRQARLITSITNLDEVNGYVQERDNALGTGGMQSKIQAAEICIKQGVSMCIVNGGKANFLIQALTGELPHTRFLPK